MPQIQYCLNASTIRPAPLLEKIRIASAAGFRALEIWHDDIESFLAARGSLAEIRHALDDQQLVVPTTIYVKGWFETTGQEHACELEVCRRRFDHAAAIGARHVIAGPPAGRADLELGAQHYRELLDIGLQHGVRPALEYLGFVDEFNSIGKAEHVLRAAGHPEGTIVHDPFHIVRGGGKLADISRLNSREIAIFHFNDMPSNPPFAQQTDADRVFPGDGCLDLRDAVRRLSEIGYTGWLSLELFREDLWQQNPLEVARTGLEKMRAIVES